MLYKYAYNLILVFALLSSPLFGQITVGDMKVGQGVTSPTDWQDYELSGRDGFVYHGIYVDVNTSSCGFITTPHYLVTLEYVDDTPRAGSGLWETSGYTAIYRPTPEGFRVLARWTDGELNRSNYSRTLTAAQAAELKYVIRWTAISTGECSRCGEMNPDPNGGESTPETPQDTTTNVIDGIDVPIDNLKLYPNPAGSVLNIESSRSIIGIRIYTAAGTVVAEERKPTRHVDISGLRPGTYVVEVLLPGNLRATKQFVKQ